ncbi:MAG: hypothetical protein ABSA74_02235 [Candidatus Staskawiczbacteria bacterium]|jgi:hypothetical protein
MKKLIISLVLAAFLITPVFVFAQTTTTQDQAKQLLIQTLTQEIAQLEQQLQQMLAQQSATNICNGLTYQSCPSGTNFICLSNGSGEYCQTPLQQQVAQSLQAKLQGLQSDLASTNSQISTLQNQVSQCTSAMAPLTGESGVAGMQAELQANQCDSEAQEESSLLSYSSTLQGWIQQLTTDLSKYQ